MSYVLSSFIILVGIILFLGALAALMWVSEKVFIRTGSGLLAGLVFFVLFGSPLIVMGVIDLGNYIQLGYRQ